VSLQFDDKIKNKINKYKMNKLTNAKLHGFIRTPKQLLHYITIFQVEVTY